MAVWVYLLADLRTNKTIAEVELTGVRVTKALGATGTFDATLPLHKRVSYDPFTVTTPARTAYYVLRDGTPFAGGILWTRRYNRAQRTVQLGGADWWSYYDHRKAIPVVVGDGSDTAAKQVIYSGIDQNQIARNLIALAHSHTGGNIGVTVTTVDSGTVRDRTYSGYEMQDIGEALRQLSKVEDGPDMAFDVGQDSNGQPTRILRLGTPHLGTQGSPFVFELDANVIDYSWPSDGSRASTRRWAVGDGIEAGTRIAMAEDTAKYTNGWALLESNGLYTTTLEQDTLQGHANADLAATALPVALPELVVTADGKPHLGEYAPGDDARFVVRAGTDPFIPNGLNTTMRIVGLSVSPNDGGVDKATLTMSPMLEDVA